MKTIRWIFFLPIAILASILLCGLFNYTFHLAIGWILNLSHKLKFITNILSATFWFSAGLIAPTTWMYIGLKIAPKPNKFAKWFLLIPCFVFMACSAIGAIFYGETLANNFVPSASLNPEIGHIILSVTAFLTTIIMIFGKFDLGVENI